MLKMRRFLCLICFPLVCQAGMFVSFQKEFAHKSCFPSHYKVSSVSKINKHETSVSLFPDKIDIKCRLKRQSSFTHFLRNDEGNDTDENDIVDRIFRYAETAVSVFQKPISFLGDISFGFIIVFLLIFLKQPIAQSGLNILLFATFSFLGRKIIVLEAQDEDLLKSDLDAIESNMREAYIQIDFFSLASSFILATLLSPISVETEITSSLSSNLVVTLLIVFGLLTITFATLQEIMNDERLAPDEKLMFQWDLKLKEEQAKNNQTKYEK
jgi:hypothetical protein